MVAACSRGPSGCVAAVPGICLAVAIGIALAAHATAVRAVDTALPTVDQFGVLAAAGYAPAARDGHAVAQLVDAAGNAFVLLFGGRARAVPPSIVPPGAVPPLLGDTWLLNVATNRWENISGFEDMPAARVGHSLTPLNVSGSPSVAILVGGENSNGQVLGDVWQFDLLSKLWLVVPATSSGPLPCAYHSAAPLVYKGEPGVLVYGGTDASGALLEQTWVLVPPTGHSAHWISIVPASAPHPPGRARAVGATLGNVPVIAGGIARDGAPLGDTWLLDAAQAVWRNVTAGGTALVQQLAGGSPSCSSSDALLALTASSSIETAVFSVGTGTWSILPTDPPLLPSAAMGQLAATCIPASAAAPMAALVFGGQHAAPDSPPWVRTMQLFTLAWPGSPPYAWRNDTPPVSPGPLRNFAASHWPSCGQLSKSYTCLVLHGGQNGNGDVVADTWLLDTSIAAVPVWQWLYFDASQSTPSARYGHRLAPIVTRDGVTALLLFGGYNASGVALGDTWSFANGQWSFISAAGHDGPAARGDYGMGIVQSASVLLFGGRASANGTLMFNDTYLFDGAQLVWSLRSPKGPAQPAARASHTFVSHQRGFAVLFGGISPAGEILDDMWIYDDTVSAWSLWPHAPHAPWPAARYAHVALLWGYKMVIQGGITRLPGSGALGVLNDAWLVDLLQNASYSLPVTSPDGAPSVPPMAYHNGGISSLFFGPADNNLPVIILYGGQTTVGADRVAAASLADGYVATVGCIAGTVAAEFDVNPCAPCLTGTYAPTPGMQACLTCPGDSYTSTAGSAVCDECVPGFCHDHGTCTVSLTTHMGTCSCIRGFISSDRCTIAWGILAAAMAMLFAILVGVLWLLALQQRRMKAFRARLRTGRLLSDTVHWAGNAQQTTSDMQSAQLTGATDAQTLPIISEADILLSECVSASGIGQLWRASWRGMPVLVRKFHIPESTIMQNGAERFLAVVRKRAEITGPPIVGILAVCIANVSAPMVVTEPPKWRTLRQLLQAASGPTQAASAAFAESIAESVEYRDGDAATQATATATTVTSSDFDELDQTARSLDSLYSRTLARPQRRITASYSVVDSQGTPGSLAGQSAFSGAADATGIGRTGRSRRWLRVALEIAQAVLLLHHRQPPVVHGMLRPDCICIDEQWHVQIADAYLGPLCRLFATLAMHGQPRPWRRRLQWPFEWRRSVEMRRPVSTNSGTDEPQDNDTHSLLSDAALVDASAAAPAADDATNVAAAATAAASIAVAEPVLTTNATATPASSADAARPGSDDAVWGVAFRAPEADDTAKTAPSMYEDSFGFGMIFWSLYTLQPPFAGMAGDAQRIRAAVKQGLRPIVPASCPAYCARLIRACWHAVPDSRPLFGEIVQLLEAMVATDAGATTVVTDDSADAGETAL